MSGIHDRTLSVLSRLVFKTQFDFKNSGHFNKTAGCFHGTRPLDRSKLATGDRALAKPCRESFHKTDIVLDKLPKRLQRVSRRLAHEIWMTDSREAAG